MIISRGFKIDVIRIEGGSNPKNYWQVYRRLMKRISTFEYDLIHAHFGQAGFVASLQHKLPFVVTFHGSDVFGFPADSITGKLKSTILKLISRYASFFSAKNICVSSQLAKALHHRKTILIPMGIDRSLFRPGSKSAARHTLKWKINELNVLFVGDPSNPVKRYGLCREVVKLASSQIGQINLRVCNEVEPSLVPTYMNASDALIVTSTHEGGPLSIREALACNLPIVSVDVGDARERLSSVSGCYVTKTSNVTDLGTALIKLLQETRKIEGHESLEDLNEVMLTDKLIQVYSMAVNS